jgi:hypothetical protein
MLLLISNYCLAAMTPSPQSSKNTPVLYVQNFDLGVMHIQYRYIDGKLTYVRFLNLSKHPMRLSLLMSTYVLGPNDNLDINPPNIDHIYYFIEPFVGVPRTFADNVFRDRFAKEYLFRLPKTVDDRVSY